MKFSVKVSKPEPQSANCCVIGIYQSKTLRDSAKNLNAQSKGVLAKYLRRGDLSGKSSEILVLRDVPGLPYQQLVVVGYGKQQDLDIPKYRKVNAAVARRLRGMRVNSASLRLHEIEVKDIGLSMRSRHLVESMASALYRFDQLKSAKSESKPDIKFNLCVDSKSDGILARTGVAQANAITTGMTLARNLANLPGNICTPSYLAGQARKLQRTYPIKTRILNKSEMEKLGMGSLLSVSRGSREPPKLICMRYSGGPKNQAPVALVGKGLTFDAGGISLKPAAKMDEMKYDMCGAASVFGTLAAIAEMKLAINVVGVVPSSENLPDGAANKPGDIVTSMSGKTIEILNTDAEGRLILCDALTFTERYKPAAVVDIATLTGACVVALGHQASGLMTNDQELADDLLSAGEQSLDRAWQLPLWDAYQSQLDSNFADIANIGGPAAGSITAGCFLSRFTGSFRWAHLDIAGTAWDSGTKKGATGRVVPLLTQFLINRCHK